MNIVLIHAYSINRQMHACMNPYIHTCMHAMHTHTHTHTHNTPMHISYIHAQVHVPTYTYTGTHIYVHTLHVNYKLVKFPPPTQNKK